jgi:hypothetical protein
LRSRIDDAYLAAHDLFVQVNYPPYRWTPVAEAAFKKAMEQGTIGWVGFHHASLLGKFDGFEMSPFFHQFVRLCTKRHKHIYVRPAVMWSSGLVIGRSRG